MPVTPGTLGPDILYGTVQADTILGLDGDDQLYGGNGDDSLYGGVDDDTLFGGNSSDQLWGDIGEDMVYGGNSDDQIHGGLDHDQLYGGNSGDTLWGDAGSDTLRGDNGEDLLYGGDGADWLDGGNADDTMTGGEGVDTFAFSGGDDVVTDFSPSVTTEVLIDFEGIASQNHFAPIPDGYMGLDWSDAFFAYDDGTAPNSAGYQNAIVSGEAGGFNADQDGGPDAEDVSFTSDEDFDFLSGYFAAAWNSELHVSIEAWDDGVQVGTATLVFDNQQVFVDFQAGTASLVDFADFDGTFDSIDEVRISTSGGVDIDPTDNGEGTQLAMDDLLLAFTSGDGDAIEVPLGTDIDALVASAESDGAGGTVLTLDGQTMTLEGVDPDAVSPDWFVFG